jgi:hypothetical protein
LHAGKQTNKQNEIEIRGVISSSGERPEITYLT